MPSTALSPYRGGSSKAMVRTNANMTSTDVVPAGSGRLLGLKVEISPTIELNETDAEYGRKQAVGFPSCCGTVYDVKQYLKSIIQLPAKIHLNVGEFCLRDDQDVSIFTCFGESVLIVEAASQADEVPQKMKRDRSNRVGVAGSFSSEDSSGLDVHDSASSPKGEGKNNRLTVHTSDTTPKIPRIKISNGHPKSPNQKRQNQKLEANGGQNGNCLVTPEPRSVSGSSENQTPRLTKSAKRRLRKLRVQERNAEQQGQNTNSISPQESKVKAFNGDSSKAKNRGVQIYESTPLPSVANASASDATYSGNTTGEFAIPKSKKARFVGTLETPLRNESEDEMSASSSSKKPRPDTPYQPKVLKNPLLFGGFKLNLSNSNGSANSTLGAATGVLSFSSDTTKPDTPNLPLVSRSPYYNYRSVDQSVLNQLSRDMFRNLNSSYANGEDNSRDDSGLATDDSRAHDKATEAKKRREELVQKLSKSLSETRQEKLASETSVMEAEATPMEAQTAHHDENGSESYFEEFKSIVSVKEINEGSVIAFKITQLNEDNSPVTSPYKEARVIGVDGSFLQLEYLKTDATQPTLLEVDGYDTFSTNNPGTIDFNWMISPKHVPAPAPGSDLST